MSIIGVSHSLSGTLRKWHAVLSIHSSRTSTESLCITRILQLRLPHFPGGRLIISISQMLDKFYYFNLLLPPVPALQGCLRDFFISSFLIPA